MKILIGLSGGFDSAYTAMLLKDAGHEVEGAVLDMHCYTETEEAESVANSLGIPLHIISCRAIFEKEVVEDFCDSYAAARTPNPCVICNEKVKFRALYDYAKTHGFDKIATGHYAKIVEKNGVFSVAVAADSTKDQSYMLYRLPSEILENLILPMGNIIKKEAKVEGARRFLSAAEREDSQDICFVKGETHAEYIERRRGSFPHGDFVDEGGRVLGQHFGIVRYTVGQRKGLGVSAKTRLFIKEIDQKNNRIILSDRVPDYRSFRLENVVFSGVSREKLIENSVLKVRVRYSAPMISARILRDGEELRVSLLEEARCAVTSGQSAVFYLDDRVAFGGIIADPT